MGDKMRKTAITLVLTMAISAVGCGNGAGSSAINKAAEVAEAASLDESYATHSSSQSLTQSQEADSEDESGAAQSATQSPAGGKTESAPEEEIPEGLREAFAKRNNDDNEDGADETGAGGSTSKSGHETYLDEGYLMENYPPDMYDTVDIFLADRDVQSIDGYENMRTIVSQKTVELYGEQCSELEFGTDHAENFVTEGLYAVSRSGAIYLYDVLDDGWKSFNLLSDIYESGWVEDALFVTYTDPNEDAYWYAYDGENGFDGVVLVALHSDMDIRLDRVEYVEKTGNFHVTEVVSDVYPCTRGECSHFSIEPAETIPQFRITATYEDLVAEWYVTYDGKGEGGVNYAIGTDVNSEG